MLGIGALGLRTETVGTRIWWAAVVAGTGTAGGMLSLVYSYAVGSFTLAFPLFMMLYVVGFVLWAYWLGTEFRDEVTKPSPSGADRSENSNT
ncbi:hypothetical protein [Natronorubrum sp. FCH18a]|uniref:hypothetical protein n=1 Tax=Natronorubrum sp. FCH18a TaxID=3447018 RepID=UPI003F50FA3F